MSENNKTFVAIHVVVLIIFFLCQWLMDISTNTEFALTNGLYNLYNMQLLYHGCWYISMIIVTYLGIKLVLTKVET